MTRALSEMKSDWLGCQKNISEPLVCSEHSRQGFSVHLALNDPLPNSVSQGTAWEMLLETDVIGGQAGRRAPGLDTARQHGCHGGCLCCSPCADTGTLAPGGWWRRRLCSLDTGHRASPDWAAGHIPRLTSHARPCTLPVRGRSRNPRVLPPGKLEW